jgi:hypothetical protein
LQDSGQNSHIGEHQAHVGATGIVKKSSTKTMAFKGAKLLV